MAETTGPGGTAAYLSPRGGTTGSPQPANLADVLDRVLDKGIVIAGDIQINLLDIELLTIKLRLLVASVERAKEMGIDWWEHDPSLSSTAPRPSGQVEDGQARRLEERLDRIERALTAGGADLSERGRVSARPASDSSGEPVEESGDRRSEQGG